MDMQKPSAAIPDGTCIWCLAQHVLNVVKRKPEVVAVIT